MKVLVAVLALVCLTGCGGDEPTVAPPVTASTTASPSTSASPTPAASKECIDLAAAVRKARLAGPTPTEEVAEEVAESLDAKLSRLSPAVHEPAVDLHGHLHDLATAQRRHRESRADELADKARADATAAAKACRMPAAEFLGAP